MRRCLISGVVLGVICLFFSGVAKADSTQNIQIGCVSVTCVSNGSILTTTTLTNATLDVTGGGTNPSGELFIAILVPVSTGGGTANFTGGTLWTALGETGGNDHTFDGTNGNDPFAGTTGYVVTDFNTGLTFSHGISATFTVPGTFPVGTMFVAFTECTDPTKCTVGTIVASSPLSESVLAVPEPSSLNLLGIGLVGLLGFARRRLVA